MGAYHSHPQRHVVSSLFSQLSCLFFSLAQYALSVIIFSPALYTLYSVLCIFPHHLRCILSLSHLCFALFSFSLTPTIFFFVPSPALCTVSSLFQPALLLYFPFSFLLPELYTLSLLPFLNSPELQEMGRGGVDGGLREAGGGDSVASFCFSLPSFLPLVLLPRVRGLLLWLRWAQVCRGVGARWVCVCACALLCGVSHFFTTSAVCCPRQRLVGCPGPCLPRSASPHR